jgi:NAD(P)-dependent dehydrogenase (short-subunit alcohol dehydrogenase family)
MSLKKKFNLEDQIFIVTGGLGLLGQQHVSAIAEFGGKTIILDTNQNNGSHITEKIKSDYNTDCVFIHCDITDEKNVSEVKDEIIRKYNNIDGLINNATIDPKVESSKNKSFSRFENFELEQWEKEIKVGLTGAMLCSKIFGYEMAKNNKGVIVNIASDLAVIAPDQRIYRLDDIKEVDQPVKPVTYSVIKHGIIGLTKYLSTYWADNNIRVNSLSPGGVYNSQNENFVKKLTNLIPMNRMANLDEYKAAIIFLLSDASSYMTGQNIIIDGGRSVW